MIAVAKDGAASVQEPVDGFRDTDRQTLYTAREPRRLVCLYHQVKVIGLDAEVEEPEAIAGGRAQGPPHDGEDSFVAQRTKAGGGPQGDMRGTTRIV